MLKLNVVSVALVTSAPSPEPAHLPCVVISNLITYQSQQGQRGVTGQNPCQFEGAVIPNLNALEDQVRQRGVGGENLCQLACPVISNFDVYEIQLGQRRVVGDQTQNDLAKQFTLISVRPSAQQLR